MKMELLLFFCFRLVLAFADSCKENPSKAQCFAYNNRFMIPRNPKCNPFKLNCRMGDYVDEEIASCEMRYSGNEQHSLQIRYELSELIRCKPEIRSRKNIYSRAVAVDTGEPRCRGVPRFGKGEFTCGEKGTRCVCDAPLGVGYLRKEKANKNERELENRRIACRCQYFLDFCAVLAVCRDSNAVCTTGDNQVTCTCPPSSKSCSLGINQCITDASLCQGQNAECIELYDQMSTWTMGGTARDDGYACVNREDMKLLKRSTHYCSVLSNQLKAKEKVKNHVDACCFQQLVCGAHGKEIKGKIMSYRPCYCNTEFRKCLNRYHKLARYKDLASTALRVLNQMRTCDIDEYGKTCNPRIPKTCRKGDFINPKIAHCKINCKTGPLLPIGQRMCSIRQCKPANHVEGVRVIDVPNRRTSSLCQAVRTLPYLCGKGDTRCVCDGRPSGRKFTDRCRCQFWPLEI